MGKVSVTIEKYKISTSELLDRDAIYVEHYGHDKWAVTKEGSNFCLADDGVWEYQPLPSSRDEKFMQRCRFDFSKAFYLANEEIVKVEKTRVDQRERLAGRN